MPQVTRQKAQPKKPPILELRAHHLLCALTFRSRGYGPDFVRRFSDIVDQLQQNPRVQLSQQADVLCRSGQNCGQCNSTISSDRDQKAIKELGQLLHLDDLDIDPYIQLSPSLLGELQQGFLEGSIRSACNGCAWFDFCTGIANDGYRRARLNA